jgi:hypothetical protein
VFNGVGGGAVALITGALARAGFDDDLVALLRDPAPTAPAGKKHRLPSRASRRPGPPTRAVTATPGVLAQKRAPLLPPLGLRRPESPAGRSC